MSGQPGREMKAGWGAPLVSRKWHYFPEGDNTSLCQKIGLFFGPRADDNDNSPDNCAECKRKVKLLRAEQERS